MTYSLSVTGRGAHNPFVPATLRIDDSVVSTPQNEQRAMSLGTMFLCQMPDGSQAYHIFDAERCVPGAVRSVRRVK